MTGLIIALVIAALAAAAGWAMYFAQRSANRHLNTQNDLLRRQVEGEEAARSEGRRARVFAHRGGRSSLDYWVEVENAGPALATHVRAWLAHAETREAATPAGEFAGLVMPGDKPRVQFLLGDTLIRESPALVLMLAWRDDEGDHEAAIEDFDVRLR